VRLTLSRSVLPALLFLALALRALVPAGFMAGTAADGVPALLPCPGVEVAARATAMHHPGMPAQHAPHGQSPCPFAAFAAPALPPEPLHAVLPSAAAKPPPAPAVLAISAHPPLAAPPPPATGPPLTA
jgi:hypothetical protein